MYEKSQQLTGNSISRLVETQRKENPYKIYENNDFRQSQNVIFRYPYLMEKSTEKIKDDSRSEKGSEKPLPRTQHRKRIFEAKSTLQSQMKHSTLSMDRNRTNSANNYDKNPVRQKIKNSSNKSYGRRVSQQSSFAHSVPLAGQPVIFNYQSPQGPLFHPTVTLGQKSQLGSRYPFGVANYSSMPIQKNSQKISLSTYPSPIFESRATHMPMKTSNIYTQQEAKLNPITPQSYIHPIGKINPSQTYPFPPGYPPVYINNNFQPTQFGQPLPSHNHIMQQKKSPQQSPAQLQNHSPIKIKNIKNILNQNPNINLQQFQPKCVNSPTIPQSLANSSNLRETSQQNQIKNIKNVHHHHDDVQKEDKNGQKQGRKFEEKHNNNGGLIIHGHGEHFPVQAFEHQPQNRNMYETYKSGYRFTKNNHPKILHHNSKQQAQIRKKAPSITSFASNSNLQQPVQYSIDLKQAQDAENLDQHNQALYSDRFFDMQIKNSAHHDQHKAHKNFHKAPEVKKHFSEDFNKSPESSPSHHQHHKIHQKDSLKPSQNLNLESPSKKQKKNSSSSYNQSKTEQTSASSQKKQAKNKQTWMEKYNNQGNLTIFFLIFLGFVLVLLQAIK